MIKASLAPGEQEGRTVRNSSSHRAGPGHPTREQGHLGTETSQHQVCFEGPDLKRRARPHALQRRPTESWVYTVNLTSRRSQIPENTQVQLLFIHLNVRNNVTLLYSFNQNIYPVPTTHRSERKKTLPSPELTLRSRGPEGQQRNAAYDRPGVRSVVTEKAAAMGMRNPKVVGTECDKAASEPIPEVKK